MSSIKNLICTKQRVCEMRGKSSRTVKMAAVWPGEEECCAQSLDELRGRRGMGADRLNRGRKEIEQCMRSGAKVYACTRVRVSWEDGPQISTFLTTQTCQPMKCLVVISVSILNVRDYGGRHKG